MIYVTLCNYSNPILFADDSNLFYTGDDTTLTEYQINDELCKISSWIKVNKVSLNIKKIHYIVFCRKRKSVPAVSIKIDGESVSQISKTEFLGVFIDSRLNWKPHILHTANKLSRSIATLVKANAYSVESRLLHFIIHLYFHI